MTRDDCPLFRVLPGILGNMIALILTIHLMFAIVYAASVAMVAFAALQRKEVSAINKVMFAGFGTTIVSGVGLIAVNPKAIGQFCVSALVATIFGVVVSKIYKHRVTAFHTAKSTLY